MSVEASVEWAKAQGSPVYDELRNIAARLRSPSAATAALAGSETALTVISPAEISNLPERLDQSVSLTANLASAFRYQAEIEPVGQLHLERIEMTPAGIEHGELVHSVPLTPKETVNITHREWSVVTKTFESIVTDSLVGFSETGVAEKTDLSHATDNEARHSSSLDVNGSVSATYNGAAFSVTASAAVDYRQQTDTTQIEKDSVAHSLSITRNASTRTKKEHKMSFRVSSVAGAEGLSVRVITNPSETNAMRVDYFQLMRKWQVDLIRYGLRMTYDIVIPNPGLDLIGRTLEIQAIDEILSTATYSFGLNVRDVTRDNFLLLSQQYGVELDAPLPATVRFEGPHKEVTVEENDQDKWFQDAFEFEVDTRYVVDAVTLDLISRTNWGKPEIWVEGKKYWQPLIPYEGFTGLNGKLTAQYQYHRLNVFIVKLLVEMHLTPTAYEAWQLKSWAALRDADKAAYDKRIEQASARKAYLQAQLAQFDALTLRKMEREEIMRWVLRWLLGPGFDLMSADLKRLFQPYPPYSAFRAPALPADQAEPFSVYPDVSQLGFFLPGQDVTAWRGIVNYGDFIKYVHDAVEWENVLFFAYPYFWDTVENWPFKRFLMHPDPIHREFLRSGAMRVVLTIRPGFEASFAMLQTGDPTAPPDRSLSYVTIGEEMRNFAMTNYEGIPPANPDNNVRPLLYPEQRKAWNDMQKLIQLIESYNDAKHNNRTISEAISPGMQTVTPSSMEGIEYGTRLMIDQQSPPPGAYDPRETVTVTATTATTFTADFAEAHIAGRAVQIDPAVKMYPTTSEFPAAIQAFAKNTPLPLTDPWGRPYHYTSPGLNADYDLVCYGKDGIPEQDQTAQQRANPLNKNITNYADGSVVGRWYEYTPTGALDVAINTVLPTVPEPS